MKQHIIISAVVFIVGLGGGYVLGSTQVSEGETTSRGQFANLSPEERQARIAEFGGSRGTGGRVGRVAAGEEVAAGEVIAKDEQGITVKLRDGGSKIIFVGGSTMIMKTASGTPADITMGTQVMVIGKTNPDGSVSATSIQLQPLGGRVGGQSN